jgi:DNA repair exonuclease SbcCD ATPase subunit
MKRFKNVIFKNIVIKGLKGYKEERSFQLYENTLITGEIGTGKSSIAEAITWCILGRCYNGSNRTNDLLNEESKEMKVVLTFNADGQDHTIVRKRTQKGTMSVTFDDMPIRQSDLESMFYSSDIFLSIFNPAYFISYALEDSKRARDMLIQLCPEIPEEEILKKLSTESAEILSGKALNDINAFITARRAELKEVEKDIIFAEGVLKGIGELEEMEIDENIDEKIADLKKNMDSDNELSKELKQLREKKENLQNQIVKLRSEIDNPKTLDEEKELEARLNNMREEYKSRVEKAKTMVPGSVCQTCGQEISEQHMKKIKASIQELYNTCVAEADTIKRRLKEIKEIQSSERQSKIKEIEAIKNEITVLDNKIAETENKVMEKISELLQRKAAQEQYLGKKKRLESAKKTIEMSESKRQELNSLITAASAYASAKADMAFETINKYFKNVSFKLMEVVKETGETKDCFKLLYNNKPYNLVSGGEVKLCGFEIADFIMSILDINYPVFVDEASSVTRFSTKSNQVFRVYALLDKPLTVEEANRKARGEVA